MNRVAIIDYGMCNLDSVKRAVEICGGTAVITSNVADIKNSDRIILPGVGAFPSAMANIRKLSIDVLLFEQVIEKRVPFLGICLGMQMIATKSWEIQETEGLGWIDGEVIRLDSDKKVRVPHMGWNEVHILRETPLFEGVQSGKDFYFVHSYHFRPIDDKVVIAETIYGGKFVSAVQKDNIFGVQFHPEKSLQSGLRLIKNFLAI